MGKTVLFPTDFSPASIAALRYAVSLAEQSDALLLVLHVRPTSTPPLGTVAPDADLAESETSLVRLIARGSNTDKRLRHEFRTLHGDPATEIVRIATEEHADLIVMATAGRSGLKRFLMGSVAEAVAREAPCPVLSLREPFVGNPAIPELGREQVVFPIDSLPPIEASETSALTLLRRAIDARATDVHIDPAGEDVEVRLRIDGRLEHYCRLQREVAHPLVSQLKIMAEIDLADPFHPNEGRFSLTDALGGYEVRMTKVPVIGGQSVALRLHNRARLVRPLNSLGLGPESLAAIGEMLRLGEGVVLVTGPTGSGKTTTAYSMVQALNDGHRNIVTIEDPIEYRIDGFRQMSVDLRHDITMTHGLRTLLRMDPDVVLVGEVRDAETAETAMRAASSGKYVFTTLHTRDVASTITALRDLHIDNRSLAGNLTGIISQRLVRRLCAHCRQTVPLGDLPPQTFLDEHLDPPAALGKPTGCPQCRNLGYFERIGVFEVVVPNRAIRQAIESGAPEDELRDLLRSAGTRSLAADSLVKVRDGTTTLEEARSMTWVKFPAN